MSTFALETQQLTYHFSGRDNVLDNIHLQVPKGAIYGFLGPNGAGKTTTLKLILGLLRLQQGTILVEGLDFRQHRLEILKRVGSLIEMPAMYSHLTATENLLLLQQLYQCPRKRVEEVLDQVGLSQAGRKMAGKFSLGMKQRLGIAMALLHQPSLLILDEPTNGLDPAGILEMRALLRMLNEENNTTILVSSHLLPEMEKLVSHIGIIDKGELLYQGALSALTQDRGSYSQVLIDCDQASAALTLLANYGLTASPYNGKIKLEAVSKGQVAAANRQLILAGINVYGIHTTGNDLEDIFIHLTNNFSYDTHLFA
ncbi:ATP-binding cassette domain-containing protein [Chitinophaga sp. 30R24]|uniref:ATP-binding cassette domain-containing protein n=1 Tax=Chitinophaga sp. 30R24 TaxID=3248838 RepID=UPI003B9173CE